MQLTPKQFSALLSQTEAPCISIYLPTHRSHPENKQDPIRFKNLLTEVRRTIDEGGLKNDLSEALQKLELLTSDLQFWNHRTEGLAILASPELYQVISLQKPVAELQVVSTSFHLKPLIRILQASDRFHLLALSRHEAKLYQGSGNGLDELEISEFPTTISAALGDELTEPHLTVASYGAGPSRAAGNQAAPSVHGHGDKKDEVDLDRDRFFRVIAKGVLEHYSRPSKLPLVLAAVTEHHAAFAASVDNPYLSREGIRKNPWSMTDGDLHESAVKVLSGEFEARLNSHIEGYKNCEANSLGSSDLEVIGPALIEGRVKLLLIDGDRHVPGSVDQSTGHIHLNKNAGHLHDDVLDDLAELALRRGGEVIVVPKSKLPAASGAAAIFRY